jgi:hypothetical protein
MVTEMNAVNVNIVRRESTRTFSNVREYLRYKIN